MAAADASNKAAERSPNESFRVYARLRPTTVYPAASGLRVVRRFEKSQIIHAKNLEFMLDWVWDASDSQDEVYNRGVRERVQWVLAGFNSTVICYGQTGSGKVGACQHVAINAAEVFADTA